MARIKSSSRQLQGLAHVPAADQLELLTQVANCSTDAVVLVDSFDRVAFANDAAIALLKISHDDLVHDFVADLGTGPGDVCQLTHQSAEQESSQFPAQRLRDIQCEKARYTLLSLGTTRPAVTEQNVLNRLSAELTSGKPLSEVLETITSLIVELTGADHAAITILDRDRSNFEIIREFPPNRENGLSGVRIPIEGFPTQMALRDRNVPVIAPRIREHAIYKESPAVQEFTERLNSKSLLIVPMSLRGQVVGAVSADHISRECTFSAEHVQLLTTIAEYAAIAIENAKLVERHRLMQQTQFLHDLSTPHLQEHSLTAIAERVLSEVSSLVGCTTASFQLLGNDRRVLAAIGFDRHNVSARTLLGQDDDPLLRDVLAVDTPTIIANTAEHLRWAKQDETASVHSWIGIPFVLQDAPSFFITLDHGTPGFYGRLPQRARDQLAQFQQRTRMELENFYLRRRLESLSILKRFEEISENYAGHDALVEGIVAELENTFKGSHASVYIRDSSRLVFKVREDLGARPRTEYLRALAERCTVLGATVVDDHTWIDFDRDRDASLPAHSAIAVPICIGPEPIGALLLYHERSNPFGGADHFMLEILAYRLAAALDRTNRLQLVQEVSETMLKEASADRLLQVLVEGVNKMTRMDAVVFRLSKDKTHVTHKYHSAAQEHPGSRLNEGRGLTYDLIKTNRPIEVPNARTDPRVNPLLIGRYQSITGIPVALEDDILGALYLNGDRLLTVNEKTFVTHLANLASMCLQRRALLEDLEQRKARYESLVNNTSQCVTEKDLNLNIVHANEAYCKSVNLTIDEVRGKSDFDFYAPEFAEEYRRIDFEVIKTKQRITREERHVSPTCPDLKWVKVVKSPVFDPVSGAVTGVHVIFWDITDEKVTRQRYESLVDQSPDAIISHDRGSIFFANSVAARLLGVSTPDELKARNILDFVHEDDRPLARSRLEALLARQEIDRSVEMRLIRTDGTEVHVEASSQLGATPGEVQVVLHDLTAVRTLLDEMHHRVKRVLSTVQFQLDAYKDGGPGAIAAIRNRVEALGLAHRMLYESRSTGVIDMQRLLTELCRLLQAAYIDTPSEDLIRVEADNICLPEHSGTLCALVVSELVSNSLLHGVAPKLRAGQNGRVWVVLTEAAGQVYLRVEDNGRGCHEGDLNKPSSMGIQLVRGMVEDDLEGTIQFAHSQGFCATAAFKL